MKREIKPHKDGRTVQVKVRMTPEEKALLDKLRGTVSQADYIVQLLKEQTNRAK